MGPSPQQTAGRGEALATRQAGTREGTGWTPLIGQREDQPGSREPEGTKARGPEAGAHLEAECPARGEPRTGVSGLADRSGDATGLHLCEMGHAVAPARRPQEGLGSVLHPPPGQGEPSPGTPRPDVSGGARRSVFGTDTSSAVWRSLQSAHSRRRRGSPALLGAVGSFSTLVGNCVLAECGNAAHKRAVPSAILNCSCECSVNRHRHGFASQPSERDCRLGPVPSEPGRQVPNGRGS